MTTIKTLRSSLPARRLLTDKRGATLVETAFALPVLVTLMIGILQFGLVLQASGAIRHGIGEGLRFAKVNPSATSTQVLGVSRNAMTGIDMAGITAQNYTSGTVNGVKFGRISLRYQFSPFIPFAKLPPITLNETRQVYLPS